MKALYLVLALTGCGSFDQAKAHITGYTTKCVEDVTYLIFPQSVTVQYESDGKVKVCK